MHNASQPQRRRRPGDDAGGRPTGLNSGHGAGRPVARVVGPVTVQVGVLMAAMAAVCIVGVVLATRSVTTLTEDLEPAERSHQEVLLDLTRMDAAVSAYAATGAARAVDAYRSAQASLPADQQEVREFVGGDAELDRAVARLERVTEAWITGYALPVIGSGGGAGALEAKDYAEGRDAFTRLVAAHEDVDEVFATRLEQTGDEATFLFRWTLGVVLALAAVSWVQLVRSRRRLLTDLSEPLLALEVAVHRMTQKDAAARAEVKGPKEVRSVATALNEFADAQARASAVEGRIQDELRVLDTAKDDFVSNVSHELRTPLTTISGYLELVADEFDGKLAPRHDRMLDATRRNVHRLRALIDDLLALSKAENASTSLEASDVVGVVRDAVTDVRITAARRDIRVEVTVHEEPLSVMSDRAMLHRAFLNVLTNAVKFSDDGGLVEVAVARLDGDVEVAVRDHGIGIPAAEIDRLGTRFFRASNAVTNEIAGTGLGLRIVQTIIDTHAGDVRIESQEGDGTTVLIHLPLHGAAVRAEPVDGAQLGVEVDPEPVVARELGPTPRR